MPKTIKEVKRLIGFTQFFRNYIPNLDEKIMSFYKLLKKDAVIETTEELVKALELIKKDLMEATNVTLRLPKPGLQYVILCDASYHGAGFVLMVEDYAPHLFTQLKLIDQFIGSLLKIPLQTFFDRE